AVEAIAVLFGLACVYLTVKQNIWCWPTGLVQVVLYVWIFYGARLYSDMLLHVFYIGLQLYGWQHWVSSGRRLGDRLPVTRSTGAGLASLVLLTAATTFAWGTAMAKLTDAALAHADAFIAAASLTAQYLLARKKLESWIAWIVVDVVAIAVFWSRGLVLPSILYAVFLVLCVAGFRDWRRSYAQRAEPGAPAAA